MTERALHAREHEQGFTLVELLVVVVILTVLILAAVMGFRSARSTARAEAMQAAAATVDQAIGTFNRMYPPTPALGDQLVSRASGVWTGNTNRITGLTDETGAWILAEWPTNPYAPGGVIVRRYAAAASCNTGQPGEIRVCRAAPNSQAYVIRAWAKDGKGATVQVYNAQHGLA